MSKNGAHNKWWKLALCGVSMLCYAAAPLAAVYVLTDDKGTVVRLYEDACANTSGWLKMKKATMKYQGKDYAACWFILKTYVILIDEAGDVTPAAIGLFRKEETI